MLQKGDHSGIEHVTIRFGLCDMSLFFERFGCRFGIIYNELYCLLAGRHKGGELCELFSKEGFRRGCQ